jgi:heme exporter protein D
MKSKNDFLAALYTIGIIGLFTLVIYSIKEYPQYMGYLFTLLAVLGVFLVFIHPLWDTIRYELDLRDKKKREARLKEMMENDQKLGLYDLDKKEWPKNWGEDWEKLDDDFFGKMDENDKNQIG